MNWWVCLALRCEMRISWEKAEMTNCSKKLRRILFALNTCLSLLGDGSTAIVDIRLKMVNSTCNLSSRTGIAKLIRVNCNLSTKVFKLLKRLSPLGDKLSLPDRTWSVITYMNTLANMIWRNRYMISSSLFILIWCANYESTQRRFFDDKKDRRLLSSDDEFEAYERKSIEDNQTNRQNEQTDKRIMHNFYFIKKIW